MSFAKQFKKVSVKIRKKDKDADYDYKKLYSDKLIALRKKKASVVKLDKPTNIVRARKLGYKAKQGVVVALVKVRKGTGAFTRPNKGRKPKRTGYLKLTRKVSIQKIAEQRASTKFSNCEVLNSYWVGEDGKDKYYEVILLERAHPVILADKNYVGVVAQKRRVYRGLTSAGKKGRGLANKGKGTEKNRPSIRSKGRKAK
jgi:large subunit ribosomal protein L15e